MLLMHVRSSDRPFKPPDTINQLSPSCLYSSLLTDMPLTSHSDVALRWAWVLVQFGGHETSVWQVGTCLAYMATKPCQHYCCLRQYHLLQLPAAPCQLYCCWQLHQYQGCLAGPQSRRDLPHHGCAAWLAALPCRTLRSRVRRGLSSCRGSSHIKLWLLKMWSCVQPMACRRMTTAQVCRRSPIKPTGTTTNCTAG